MFFKDIFFLKLFKKNWYRRKRKEISFYKALKKNDSFNLLNLIQNGFRVAGPKEGFNCFNLSCSAISVNQYLAYRFQNGTLIGNLLVHSIFKASQNKNKRIPFPVPFIWWSTLGRHGLRVAPIRSFFYWKSVCLIFFIYSFIKIIKSTNAIIFKGPVVPKKPFTVLLNLTESNMQKKSSESRGYTIVDWFKKNYGVTAFVVTGNFDSTTQGWNSNIFKWDDPLGPLSIKPLLKLLIFTLALCCKCLVNLIFGNGYQAAMFYELWLLRKSQIIPDKNIASEYGFSNSDYIYKPLWAENLEKRGASVVLYFYSLNCCPYVIDNKVAAPYYGYTNMTWSRYLVWHKDFIKFLKPLMFKEGKVEVVPPIFFSDSGKDVGLSNLAKKILVFDVAPVKKAFLVKIGHESDYFCEKTSFLFFKDLPALARKHDVTFVVKQKRVQSDAHASKKYRNLCLRLEQDPGIEILDADISAHRSLENCLGAISMPFTSTSHIATANNIPSIYYDPSERLEKGQFASLGIKMLSSLNELDNWIEKINQKR